MSTYISNQRQDKFRSFIFAVVFLFFHFSAMAVGPWDAQEWKTDRPISVTITEPADNTYLPINHSINLFANASDPDCYRVGQTWYTYADEVQDGDLESDYHILWEATGGGTLADQYGVAARYDAPDYSQGNDVRNVTVKATADDFNRGTDKYGDNDDADDASITLKIWQVTVSIHQSGSIDDFDKYDGPDSPPTKGGKTLGWIIPGTPAGAEVYGGNTLIKGTIPEGPAVTTGYSFIQFMKGLRKHKDHGNWTTDYDEDEWESDITEAAYDFRDIDSRSSNGTGEDARQIFLLDCPRIVSNAANNLDIAEPAGYTDQMADMDYKPMVMLNGNRISNEIEYEFIATLQANAGGVWTVVGQHTP